MRSSWVSWTLVKDNVERFWPLWAAFLGAWVLGLLLPLSVLSPQYPGGAQEVFLGGWQAEYVASLFGTAAASVVAVALVFEYLFSPTSAQFHGSLPLTRTALFASAFISGLLPLVIVELLVGVVALLMAAVMPQIIISCCFEWLGLTIVFTFISYCMACLCAQLTGSKAMTSWLFVLGNALILMLEVVLRCMAECMLTGVELMTGTLSTIWTSPLGGIMWYALGLDMGFSSHELTTENMLILAAYALVALVFLAVAVLLNKRRDLEQAGNTAAYQGVRVVFKYVIGICTAIVVGFIALFCMIADGGRYISNGQAAVMTVFMVVGGFAGIFFGELALTKSSRGIGKFWRGGLAVAVLSVAFTGCCVFDVFNIKGYVPDPSQVESVELNTGANSSTVADHELIESLTEVHRDITELPAELVDGDNVSCYVEITYNLEGGRKVCRFYDVECWADGLKTGESIPEGQAVLDELSAVLSTPSFKLSRFEPFMEADYASVDVMLVTGWDDEDGFAYEEHVDYSLSESFWKAFKKDLGNEGLGNVSLGITGEASRDGSVSAAQLEISGYLGKEWLASNYGYEWLQISPKTAPNTCAWFTEHYGVKFE